MSVSSMSRSATRASGPAPAPAPAGRGLSPRLRLAREARDAALRVGGVLALDAGEDGRFAVVSGSERIDGVLCVATAGGGYDVALQLVCALVPLIDLGERVRAGVRATASAAGLPLAAVSVHVVGIAAPGEA